MTSTWKGERRGIARLVRIASIPKDLRRDIVVDERMEKAYLFSENERIPTPLQGGSVDLSRRGKKSIPSGTSSILFMSYSKEMVEIAVSHRGSNEEPRFDGKLKVEIGISSNAGSPLWVFDEIFGGDAGYIGKGRLGAIIKSSFEGGKGEILSGLRMENLRDEELHASIEEKAESWISEDLISKGLEAGRLTLKWSRTSTEKTEATRAATEAIEERGTAEIERTAVIEVFQGSGKRHLEKRAQEAVVRVFATKQREKEEKAEARAEAEVAAEIEKGENELARIRREREIEEAEHKESLKALQNNGELSELERKTEMEMIQAEAEHKKRMFEIQVKGKLEQIAQQKADGAAERKRKKSKQDTENKAMLIREITKLAEAMGDSADSTPLTAMMDHFMGAGEDVDYIDESTLKRLKAGNLPAKQIDEFVEKLREMASTPGRSDVERSDIWAAIAIYQKARGNKGGKMHEALDESRNWNSNNITAFKCELDYNYYKHSSQFNKGKINQHAHMRKQVSRSVELLETILSHEDLDPEDAPRLAGMYVQALEAMTHDEEEPEKYEEKKRKLYAKLIPGVA